MSRSREPSLARELLLSVAGPIASGLLTIAQGIARREHEALIRRREAAATPPTPPKRRR